jgi:dethiobiotin synthetase
VVELAGGVLVPLNDEHTNLDLIVNLGLPVVVVSRHYLGSINHTLLTLEVLRSRGVAIRGIVFNGQELPDTERIIARLGKVEVLGRVPHLEELSRTSIHAQAQSMTVGV